jgi:glycyl-tRNA synthetase alpha subunit
MGAGTMHRDVPPGAGPAAVNVVHPAVQAADRWPLRRESNRLFKHHQFQVILKPAPTTLRILPASLEACGIDLALTSGSRKTN